jgi:ribonuclease D
VSTNIQTSPKELLTSPQELAALCAHLAQVGKFAFDTEFIGEDSYEPRLCLVQIATEERVELIDPQAIGDLSPLWQLMADPAITKICHAGDQDLTIVYQKSKLTSRNVFDTQLGAGLVGLGFPLAYWRLAELYTGISLEKAHTYSAWDRRPLSPDQLTYAVDDVLYLPKIHAQIHGKLSQLGRVHWMDEACNELCASAAEPVDPRKIFLRIKGMGNLQPIQAAALQELCAWREQLAFEHNIPPRSMMKDTLLMEIATRMPKKDADLSTIRGLSPAELQTYAGEIVAAVNRARKIPPEQRPVMPAPIEDSLETKRLAETLWVAAQAMCLGQSVTPGLATSQTQIVHLARAISAKEPFDVHALMQGWRAECLGRPLLAFLQGQSSLCVRMDGEGLSLEIK